MKGKLIGILSDDFRIYYELVAHLKSRDMPFMSLSSTEKVPINVGAVITTPRIAKSVTFENKVVCRAPEDVEFSVNKAIQLLKGKDRFEVVIVGIDPGAKPGIAVLGDDEILNSFVAKRPEDVLEVVRKTRNTYSSRRFKVKIGHGDKVNRNRIINSLVAEDFVVEVVDERSTTKSARHSGKPSTKSKGVDAFAALQIARGDGRQPKELGFSPTKGELKLVQSRSRELSSGRVTISKKLAGHVAKGDLTLKRALRLQYGKKGGKRTGETGKRRKRKT